MCCYTNQFLPLTFCGPHPKHHGARGLSKYYHLSFDKQLVHAVCAIFRIPCACVACTSKLENLVFMVYLQRNNNSTNLSQIVLNGQFLAH